MLLRQLKYFITIVDSDSFTEAAEKCFISQSAISQQMKSLEEELGVTLLVRTNRQLSLTEAGEYFYRHGKALLNDFDHVITETKRRGEDHELSLKIGYLKGYGATELHQAVASFSSTYPEVSFSIMNGTHEELYHVLRSHDVDLLISDQRRAFNEDYFNYELMLSDCFIEISSYHPLSKKTSLSFEDLKGLTCIVISTKDQVLIEEDFYKNTLGFHNQFLFSETLEDARLMVVSQRGFMPIEALGTLTPPAQGIARIPLINKGKPLQRKFCAFWEKERTNYYIEEFVDVLRQLLVQ